MSTTVDAVSGAQGNASSLTWSHTSAGNFLAVNLAMNWNGSNPVTSVTCNGTAMTMSPAGYSTSQGSTGFQISGAQYTLKNPGSGTLTIVATLNRTLNFATSSVTTTGGNSLLTQGIAAGPTGDTNSALTLSLTSGALCLVLISTPETGPEWVNPAAPTLLRNFGFGGMQEWTYGFTGSGSQNINLTWAGAQFGGWVMAGLLIGAATGRPSQPLQILPGWGKRVN